MGMQYQNFITNVLEKSAQLARANFGKVQSTTKAEDNNQVLTQTDIEIGRYIITEIEREFPKHNIIDEEAGVINKNSEFTWVVDPIDGTSNFANGVPTYGIMIGLLQNDQPRAGGIALPSFNEIYFAEKEAGAFCNSQKIMVTAEENLLSTLVAYGIDGHQENPNLTKSECKIVSEIVLHIRNLRSSNSVFDLVMLAKGCYGAAMNQTNKIWDNVAQHILVEEAGGVYTDFFGNPMDYKNALQRIEENFTYCAGAPQLHQKLQEIIHSLPNSPGYGTIAS